MNRVSFVCTTYRRFTCVQRIVAQYYAQTHLNKELIIFNTDIEYPYSLSFEDSSIIVVNNDLDYQTGMPYTNRGQICRDAITHSTGDYFMLADDDDIYLPWHIQQAVDMIQSSGRDAWKPRKSFFAMPNKLELISNVLEASVIVKMDRMREIGFQEEMKSGYEHLSWYTILRDERQLLENEEWYIPSYCFNWSDPHEVAGHKQSGDINNPENFENHKQASTDFVKRPLTNNYCLTDVYLPYFNFIKDNLHLFDLNLVEKYVSDNI